MANKNVALPQAIAKAVQLYQGTLLATLDNRWYTLEFPNHDMMYYWVRTYDQWEGTRYISPRGRLLTDAVKITVDTKWPQ
jgi:hypothetical protein